jgi:hypothetical protein
MGIQAGKAPKSDRARVTHKQALKCANGKKDKTTEACDPVYIGMPSRIR